MANHGGGPTTPTALLPPLSRAPFHPRPVRAMNLSPSRPVPPVTLTLPRPENERSTNEYVEAPFRPATLPPPAPPRPIRLELPLPPVTKQPAASFSKDPPNGECATRPSIVCPDCGRCRCESCQQPRPLPQKWVCNNSYLISADSIIDYASCLCCVKGLFYHCSDTDGEQSCADTPCGCNPDKRVARWSCLAALSCVLPCLWLYWPLRGCKRVVEACYARHSRTGCRCRPPLPTPEKRLLDSSGAEF